MWYGLLWFWFAFPWWLMMLSIFSCAFGPFVYLLWRNLLRFFFHFKVGFAIHSEVGWWYLSCRWENRFSEMLIWSESYSEFCLPFWLTLTFMLFLIHSAAYWGFMVGSFHGSREFSPAGREELAVYLEMLGPGRRACESQQGNVDMLQVTEQRRIC